jgi:hypothetical protein
LRLDKFAVKNSVKAARPLFLTLVLSTCCTLFAHAESLNVTGKWKVEITLGNEQHRFLRFDAQTAGKGTLTLTDPQSKDWGAAKPFEAKWSQGEGNSVTFSGPVEFLIGNVGRDAGNLTCKGKFETADLITGEAEFSPLVGDRLSRSGTFKAVREKQ